MSIVLMLRLAELVEMRKRAEQKNVFFRLEIRPIGGTLRTKDRNYGMFTTVERIKEKVYASFRSRIGQS